MKSDFCPYCKEEIKANATVCKHCQSSLWPTRRHMAIAEIAKRINVAPISGSAIEENISPYKAWCYFKHGSDKAALNECLDDAKAASAVAIVAERMHAEFFDSMWEYLLGKGDIDPIPFEKFVRERFSRGQ